MTETASADDPALAKMVHPDVAKTLELLDQAGSMPPMKLRPGAQVAQLMWAQQFKGGMASIDDLFSSGSDLTAPAKGTISDRKVKTAAE
jgi:gamma-glutamyltranspeptidase